MIWGAPLEKIEGPSNDNWLIENSNFMSEFLSSKWNFVIDKQ